MKVELVILNYNGGELFLECLASLQASLGKTRYPARLVILDNQSTDGSDRLAKIRFPGAEVIRMAENRYLCSYNDYLKQSDCDIALLLNNDIKVDPDFIDPLIEPFEKNPQVFMVTPKCLSFDGSKYEGGITRFRMHYGIFWASARYPGYEKDRDRASLTMAAGYGAFDRKKFLELGGYDDLYLPGRLEDSDLCFRAWQRGWLLLYEPRSVIYHKGGVAFHKRFGERGTLRINHRNSFLFVWKNVRDPLYLVSHFFFLPFRLLFALIKGQMEFVLGFFDSLPLAPKALRRRMGLRASQFSDREIFNQV